MNALKKYKRRVSDMLPCTKEERKYCLDEIDRSLGKEASSMSYEAIVEELGSPETLAASAIQDMESEDIAAAMKTRTRLFRWIAILVAGFLLVWALGVTIALIDTMNQSGGTSIVTGPSVEEIHLEP